MTYVVKTRGMQEFKHMPDATLSQAAPVQNTWYTLLDTVYNVELLSVYLNIATASETLECRITVDGNVLTGSLACTFATAYYISLIPWLPDAIQITNDSQVSTLKSYMLKGKSLKIEVRKTTAAGAGTLTANAKYRKVA